MPFSRKSFLFSAVAVQCLVAAFAAVPARADTIPAYFFAEWTVSKNCTEQHAGLAARVQSGLKLKISADSLTADGSYVVEAENTGSLRWAANWNGIKLQYRPGTSMSTLPADFECIPGQEATSPFLAMSNYAQATEPYYEQAHWYGIAKIHGQLEHVLVFPRDTSTGPRAVVVLQSVNAPSSVQLDDNGVLHMQ
ncbi:MAG: hypothetical protein QOI59_5481 [Gammaproteobacteria bacterium]|jgi:hypothetical protein|nr:hypothetical protein [Gammaproteobacteria bacterium]